MQTLLLRLANESLIRRWAYAYGYRFVDSDSCSDFEQYLLLKIAETKRLDGMPADQQLKYCRKMVKNHLFDKSSRWSIDYVRYSEKRSPIENLSI